MLCQTGTKISKCRRKFIEEMLVLFLLILGRIDFLQFSRYGRCCEQRFCQQFSRYFDWFGFNKSLAQKYVGKRVAIAINSSYSSKSDKHIPYISENFGRVVCAGSIKHGLEITRIGLINTDLNICFHLEAIQTPPSDTLMQVCHTLIDWYLYIKPLRKLQYLPLIFKNINCNYRIFRRDLISKNVRNGSRRLSRYIVADGVILVRSHLISRLRYDAVLMYLTREQPLGRRGRPLKYDGKIQPNKIDESCFEITALRHRLLQIFGEKYMVVYQRKSGGKSSKVILLDRYANVWIGYLRLLLLPISNRILFQRRQTTYQSRDSNQLHFHVNAFLMAVNIAKIRCIHTRRPPFRFRQNIVVVYIIHRLLQRFIRVWYCAEPAINSETQGRNCLFCRKSRLYLYELLMKYCL